MHPAVVGHRITVDNLNAATGGDAVEDDPDSPVEAFEQNAWRRPVSRLFSENDNVVLYFEIPYARVISPVGSNIDGTSSGKKYVVYEVEIRQVTSDPNPAPTVIKRRYTHFLKLYDDLRKKHALLMQGINFPKKVLVGNFSGELIGERSEAFENLLDYIVTVPSLRDSEHFLEFLQGDELNKACQLLDERRNEFAVPILENTFRVLNKIFLDKSMCVLLLLCRLVAACTTSPIPHPLAEQWAELALRRYEHVCDADLLVLYIPLLQTCLHLWWQRGRDRTLLEERLDQIAKKGIKVKGGPTLTQAIHALDPRAETT
ncbi:sorting nexin-21 isoform X2 [Armigeres subalbatus]|uniref:sorting nexin-21 isoform X2 n=1 Tax=Armigeres subalbatus TaxID=124917 RepID=UPI002ED41B2D